MNEGERHYSKNVISDREREVIKYVSQGISNAEIGSLMCLSSRTIESHRRNILQKLELKNTAELIAYAIKNKWA
ncbi:MAG: response regulator transcription factor [Flavobacteriales bacterium]